MNGNDYLEIEETQAEQIMTDYIASLEYEDIPREFVNNWIDSYLQGSADYDYETARDLAIEEGRLKEE